MSATPEEGALNVTAPADRDRHTGTASWTSRAGGGSAARNEEIRPLSRLVRGPRPAGAGAPAAGSARQREAFPLTAAGYEEDTEAALADLLARAGFAGDQCMSWVVAPHPLAADESGRS